MCFIVKAFSCTADGNMRTPSRKSITQWVLEAGKSLSEKLIRKSFKICALSGSFDESDDDEY